MGILNPSKSTKKTEKKPAASTTAAKVAALAKSGNTAAQAYQAGKPITDTKKPAPVASKPIVTPKKTVTTPTKTPAKVTTPQYSVTNPLTGGWAMGKQSPTSIFGKTTPKLEFSVTPGAKSGPIQYSQQFPTTSAQSSMPYARTEAEQKKLQSDVTASTYGSIAADIASVPLLMAVGGPGPDDAANLARLTAKYGPKAKGLFSTVKSMGAQGKELLAKLLKGGADNAVEQVVTKADDVARRATTADDLIALRNMRTVQPAMNAANTTRSIISGLGRAALGLGAAAAVGGPAYEGYNNAVTTAGQVRNAVPSTGGATATTGEATGATTGTTETATGTTTPSVTGRTPTTSAAAQDFAKQLQEYQKKQVASVPAGGGAPQRTVSPSSVTGGGAGGGTAPVGEPMTDAQAAAQASAIELSRANAAQANVGVAPIGDQVDLAGLQSLRDKTKAMLDQYGADATTMPEFKANVQAMISAGVENLRKIQPTPPEPVVDTQAQADLFAQDTTGQMQAYADEQRRALGMTDLEKQRIDLQQQMNAVQETYQRVLDDIKQNPNFPKGLAARRLSEVFEDQKFAVNSLLAQLNMVEDQLEDANKQLDRNLGIYQYDQETAQAKAEKAWQKTMDQFGYITESGAVAGLNDKEIRQWAAATGIPEGAIRAMKAKASEVDKQYDVSYETDANGNTTVIYANKNDPMDVQTMSLGQISKGFAPKASTGTSSGGGGIGSGEIDDLDMIASLVFGKSSSVASMKADQATYAQLKAQDPKKAEQWLYGKVASYLPATAKNDFRVMGSVVDGADSLIADLEEYARTNPGVYKAAYNSAAPYLTASRDQKYVELMQRLTATGNEYRNAIFGASLTGNEQSEGQKVVFSNNDDLPTIITKLKGLKVLGNDIRQRIILDNAGMVGTSLQESGPGTINAAVEDANLSTDDQAFNSVVGDTGEGGGVSRYFKNLWGAITGK